MVIFRYVKLPEGTNWSEVKKAPQKLGDLLNWHSDIPH